MAEFVELYVDQGADFSCLLNLTDDVTNQTLNVTNYQVSSQMKRSYYSSSPTANLICDIVSGPDGEITLSLPAANTANIKSGRYLFDVKITDLSGTISRVVEGIITVNPGITR